MSVVRLADKAPGLPLPQDGFSDWLESFCNADVMGNARTVILVVQDEQGILNMACQSIRQVNIAELIGLLSVMSHRLHSGEGMDL